MIHLFVFVLVFQLTETTKANSCFLAFAAKTSSNDYGSLTVNVVNETRLACPRPFLVIKIWKSSFDTVRLLTGHRIHFQPITEFWEMFNQSQTTVLDVESLSAAAQLSLNSLMNRRIADCLLVPFAPSENHQHSLLVALVDKQDGLSFNTVDLQAVHHCLR